MSKHSWTRIQILVTALRIVSTKYGTIYRDYTKSDFLLHSRQAAARTWYEVEGSQSTQVQIVTSGSVTWSGERDKDHKAHRVYLRPSRFPEAKSSKLQLPVHGRHKMNTATSKMHIHLFPKSKQQQCGQLLRKWLPLSHSLILPLWISACTFYRHKVA